MGKDRKNFDKRGGGDRKFKPKFGQKFGSFRDFQDNEKPIELTVDKISIKEHDGKNVIVRGVIDRVAQTSGPTLFSLGDGTGTLMLKGFDGAGVRAYPEVKENDIIVATVKIKEYESAIEGEIERISKLEGEGAEAIKKTIEELEKKRATVIPPVFLAKSPILDKLKERFVKAATEIRLAIIKSRPIIVRHHNDCDGYSAGYSLERAIVPLIIQQHGGGKAPWEYYTRSPCNAPLYEIEDSIKDAAHSLADAAKFSNKMPLVVIVDTGSGEEDLIGIQQGRIHGMDFIVVDHHFFEKDLVSDETLVHINPFLEGEDGSKFSAGMLCTELSRFINPDVKTIEYIAALSGLADRIDNPPVMNEYISIAEKKGYTKELLHDISALIDFVSTKLRFMEAREYIEVVFGDPIDKQKKLVKILVPKIRMMEARGLSIAKSAAKKEKIGKLTFQILEIEQSFSRNAYPKPGKVTGMLHDNFQEETKDKNVVTIGLMPDAITMRATLESKFSVHDFIAYVTKHNPEAFVEGGGHHQAGAIRFVPSTQGKVMESLRNYIKSLK